MPRNTNVGASIGGLVLARPDIVALARLERHGKPRNIEIKARVTDMDALTARRARIVFASGITSVRTSRPSLEDVYMHLIGDRGLEV